MEQQVELRIRAAEAEAAARLRERLWDLLEFLEPEPALLEFFTHVLDAHLESVETEEDIDGVFKRGFARARAKAKGVHSVDREFMRRAEPMLADRFRAKALRRLAERQSKARAECEALRQQEEAEREQGAEREAAGNGVGVVEPPAARENKRQYPRRAEWLRRELAARRWTVADVLRKNGAPDRKTINKILAGKPVREDALARLAAALSESSRAPKVSLADIPND